MSFNAASLVKVSSGPYRLWLYETQDNLASLEANSGATSTYFRNANAASLAGGAMGLRRGDVILAVNSSTSVVSFFGVVQANYNSVTVQSNVASHIHA